MTSLSRVAAVAVAAAAALLGLSWLLFAAWLATPLSPCPLEGAGACDRPTLGLVLLAGLAVLPGAIAMLAGAASLLRWGLGGGPPRRGAVYLFIASLSIAVAMVWISV